MATSMRSDSRRIDVVDTATILRRAMLALAAAGVVATTLELATLRHWTTTTQIIPWIVLAVLGVGIVAMALGASPRVIRVVRLIACLAIVGGLYGLFTHVQSNYHAAILDHNFTDRWPDMSLAAKLWAAGTGEVGPSPVMAPAVLSQCAVCLALCTLRHPRRAPSTSIEAS